MISQKHSYLRARDLPNVSTPHKWIWIDSLRSTAAVLPTHYFSAHQSAIRALSWIRAPTFSGDAEVTTDDPTVIVSGGYDGSLAVRDLREPTCNEIYRTRGSSILDNASDNSF